MTLRHNPYSPTELKSAYRKAAKLTHPDYNKSPNATEEFLRVQAAYQFLSTGASNIDYLPINHSSQKPEYTRAPDESEFVTMKMNKPIQEMQKVLHKAYENPGNNEKDRIKKVIARLVNESTKPDQSQTLVRWIENAMESISISGPEFDKLEQLRRSIRRDRLDEKDLQKTVTLEELQVVYNLNAQIDNPFRVINSATIRARAERYQKERKAVNN